MLYSTSLDLVTVGQVCPGFRSAGSSESSSMSKLGDPMRSVPFSHCCLAILLSSRTSSNQGSPVISPFSLLISFTIPMTHPLSCIHSNTGFRSYWDRSTPSVLTHVP